MADTLEERIVPAQWVHESRPLERVRNINVAGSVRVAFYPGPVPELIVAAQNGEILKSVQTLIKGDTLHIGQEGANLGGVVVSGGNIYVTGRGNVVAGRSINIAGNNVFSGNAVVVGGQVVSLCEAPIIGIVLPEAAGVVLSGSGDIDLYDLRQPSLTLTLAGSGDIRTSGVVGDLLVTLSGSGNVDTENMDARRASLTLTGSGDIESYVTESVSASVVGSGRITVYGDPEQQSESVVGSGRIRFR